MSTKKLELKLKLQCYNQICMILVMHILLWKELLLLQNQMMQKETSVAFKKKCTIYQLHFKDQSCRNWPCRTFWDVVMSMYNFLECSKNYRKTTACGTVCGSLWNYYRDQPNNPLTSNFESFKHKYYRNYL